MLNPMKNNDAQLTIPTRPTSTSGDGQMVWVPPGYELAAEQAEKEQSQHLWDYLWLLWHRRWLIGLIFTLCTTLAVVAMLRATPIYEAATKLKVEPESGRVLTFEDIAASTANRGIGQTFISTQMEILKSRTLAAQVVEQLGLYLEEDEEPDEEGTLTRIRATIDDSVNNLVAMLKPVPVVSRSATTPEEAEALNKYDRVSGFLRDLEISHQRDTDIVMIVFRGPDPALCAEVSNALCDAYLRFNYETKLLSYENADGWIGQKLLEVRGKLETAEEEILEFSDGVDVIALSSNLEQYMTQYQETEKRLAEAEQVLAETKFRSDALDNGEFPEVEADKQIYRELLTQLRLAEISHAQASVEFGPDMIDVRKAAAALEGLRAALKEEEELLKQEQLDDQEREKDQVALELGQAEKTVEFLKGSYTTQEQRLVSAQKRLIQFDIIKREANVYEGLHNSLLERSREVSVVSGMEPSNVIVVERAETPPRPALPNKRRNVLLGAFLGLFLGVGLAFFLEYMDTSVKNAEEIERLTQIAILGFVPHYEPTKRSRRAAAEVQVETISHESPKSAIAENFRFLRTAIQYSVAGGAPKTILVTSCLAREGKTTTATNLAITLAQRGHKTLLIDADLKKPSIHYLFDVSDDQGLSEILTGKFDDVIPSSTAIANLDVLASGTRPPNPVDLLDSDAMRDLLVAYSEQYEHIVIDSPPSLELADTSVLVPYVDGVVFVIRPGTTPREAVVSVKEKLAGVGCRFLGIVLNNPQQKPAHRYGYGGYGYGGYGYGRKYGYGYGQTYGGDSPKGNGRKAELHRIPGTTTEGSIEPE